MKLLGSGNFASCCCDLSNRGKSGMALVIVLGLLALLIISSVAFTIAMRVERASSANVRNTTMAREVAKSALTFAIAAIDDNIKDASWPMWENSGDRLQPDWIYHTDPSKPLSSDDSGRGRTLHFWKDTFCSADHYIPTTGSGNGNSERTRAIGRLMNVKIEPFLPNGIMHRAYATKYWVSGEETAMPSDYIDSIAPEWVPMTSDPTNQNVVGRYAFLAFNTSGYLEIPSLCAGGGEERGSGASPAEIQVIPEFFYGKHDSANLKRYNADVPFETVAEIKGFSKNKGGTGSFGDGTVFAPGAAYSAYNFTPIERICTNGLSVSMHAQFFESTDKRKFPFRNKINLYGDGSDDHLADLRRHKAAIIAAFQMSGLTASSANFSHGSINDEPCKGCSVCGNGTPAFTLDEHKPIRDNRGHVVYLSNRGVGVEEQALWAYLSLIDYIDEDDTPEEDEDIDINPFARPASELSPRLNGFMATLKLTRNEIANGVEVTIGYKDDGITPIKETRQVFDGTNAEYRVEFNGKVVFSNRFAFGGNSEEMLGRIFDSAIESRMGLYMEGDQPDADWASGFWEPFLEVAKKISLEDDATVNEELVDYLVFDSASYLGDPIRFVPESAIVFTNRNVKTIVDPRTISDDKKETYYWHLPQRIMVSAAGQAFAGDGGDLVARIPPNEDFYAEDPESWLSSQFFPEDERLGFEEGQKCVESTIGQVYATMEDARIKEKSPDYALKSKSINIILWSEMLDPAFCCNDRFDDYMIGDLEGNGQRVAIPSHASSDSGNSEWRNFRTASAKSFTATEDFHAADDLVSLTKPSSNGDFDDFVEEFKSDATYFGDYFEINPDDNEDRYPGISAFQIFMLNEISGNSWDSFKGVMDGAKSDGYLAQFNSLHIRNGGFKSVGELGFISIGPFATIRLFGYDSDCNYSLAGIDQAAISIFNQPKITWNNSPTFDRPYHRVLDFFTARAAGDDRGRIHLGSSDILAVASAFNNVPLNDEILDDPAFTSRALECVDHTDALDSLAPAFIQAMKDSADLSALTLSDIGRLYEADSMDDYFGESGLALGNAGREALIRNTCGLFTTRGLNFTLLLRGEAFTPFFGRTDVKSDLGTTLASRTAIAQIWRDTEPDENGKYPVFVHFFKIFDE